MSERHTPGPWKPEIKVVGTCTCGQTPPSRIGYVKAPNSFGEVAVLFSGGERLDANVQLLAAAPTMLDALREAADVLDDYSDVNDGDDGLPRPNKAMSALQIVEAAIAKAEGH